MNATPNVTLTRPWVRIFTSIAILTTLSSISTAEHEGKVQILLLGDSTTEGSIPRKIKPVGPHLETVLEQLLAAEGDLPPCEVRNVSISGEFIYGHLHSGRYDRLVAGLPGVDYVFIRYGLNDHSTLKNFKVEFPQHYRNLIKRLRSDHPRALLIPMTVIPFATEEISKEINDAVRQVAQSEQLEVFDIYPRYAAAMKHGPNMLHYRRYPLAKIPEKYHGLVDACVVGPDVIVMANELDPILGHLPGWFGDRHPNLAGYNVIALETASYLAKLLRQSRSSAVQPQR